VKKISIIIVHYNQPDHLERCLESIHLSQLPASTEILVIDNASKDPKRVHQICSNGCLTVKLICNPANLGLARAANIAAKKASGSYILNLNPDVMVENDAITVLEHYLDQHPHAGIAFPRLLNPDGSLQLSCRTHYDALTILLRRTPLGKLYNGPRIRNHLMTDWDHREVREIDWAVGAAFMIRREALNHGFLFDNRYFLYMEDVDLCLTLRQRGWGVYYVPSAVMTHHHIRSSGNRPLSKANWEHFKSFIRFEFKHGGFNECRQSHATVHIIRSQDRGEKPC
jgi:hypothetical protein